MSLIPRRLYKVDLHTSVFSVAANNAFHRLSRLTFTHYVVHSVELTELKGLYNAKEGSMALAQKYFMHFSVFYTRVSEIHNVEVRRAYDVLLAHVTNRIHTLSVKSNLKSKYGLAWGHGGRRSKHRSTINYWSYSTSRTVSATRMNVCKRSVLVKQVLSLD